MPSQLSAVSAASSQDHATAMSNWLWQYTAAAAAAASTTDEFGVTPAADPLQPNATIDAMTNGVIVYQLNADGTQSAVINSVPPGSSDVLEPGEVRLPVTGRQTNGVVTAGQLYNTAAQSSTPWLRGSATIDSEKQLLRGALVDKVREIQRLTRELEQAYALIHQLKQHSELLHRQWGQMHVTSDPTP